MKKIDGKKIINETHEFFTKTGFMSLLETMNTVSELDYKKLHTKPLVATNITIDTVQLAKDVEPYVFQQWGDTHEYLPRYGLALVNQSGQLIDNDPINGSLVAWNKRNPDKPLLETDCTIPTEVLAIPALKPLKVLQGFWCRSNVLKWNKGGLFTPHIDTCLPSPWLRLWMASEGVVLRFYNEDTGYLVPIEYEPGRLYIIDTSIIHNANAIEDNVYQLFLSVNPDSYSILESLVSKELL
jgi:hypothetical protein